MEYPFSAIALIRSENVVDRWVIPEEGALGFQKTKNKTKSVLFEQQSKFVWFIGPVQITFTQNATEKRKNG